jgi:hypothetical protein
MLKFTVIPFLVLASGIGVANAADTQGKVSKIVTLPVTNGKHVIRIYFSSYTNDRWGCLQNPGYIEANDGAPNLDAKGLDRLVALATTAMAADMTLGIDSSGVTPCTEGVMFYLIKE